MKSIFVALLLVVAILASLFVAYGVYLNSISVSYIESVQARRVVAVAASAVRRREFRPGVGLSGINLQTETMTDVVCQVEGTLVKILVAPGDMVKKGQKVCVLDNPLLPLSVSRAEAEVSKAAVNSHHAAIGLERAKNLRQEKAISQSDLDAAQAQMLASEAEELAARVSLADAKQRVAFQEVTSLMHGEILLVYQKEGSYLNYGTSLMLVGDFSSLTFSTHLSNDDFSSLLPLEKEYEFTVDLIGNDKGFKTNYAGGFGKDTVFKATILDLSPPLDQPATFRNVKWSIDNHLNALEPGVYTDTGIRRPAPVTALLVPAFAILPDGDSVFVMTTDGKLDRRQVKTGRTDGESVEILEGLAEGDVVVESDVSDLRLGDAIAASLSEGGDL